MFKLLKNIILAVGFAVCIIFPAAAQVVTDAHTQVELVSENVSVTPGKPFWVGIRFKMDPGWHIYSRNPGDSGLPPKIKWELPAGFKAGELQWPYPQRFVLEDIVTYGYSKEVVLLAEIFPPDQIHDAVTLRAHIDWLACEIPCIPGKADVSLTLPVAGSPVQDPAWHKIFEETRTRLRGPSSREFPLVMILAFAFLGGIILNLMPCVFPVLSIKVLTFINHAQDRVAFLKSALGYTLGIVLSFIALAGLLIFLKKGGEALGWGFQFQSPYFVVAISFLLFIMALNLLGFFEWNLPLGLSLSKESDHLQFSESFLNGILTVIVATPCTAPFMGTALSFGLTQTNAVNLLIFAFLGLGLAFPFIVLASFPGLTKILPKPGIWMENFKKFLSIPLLLTVIWLLWVLAGQKEASAVRVVLLGMFFVGLGFGLKKWAAQTLSIALIVGGIVLPFKFISTVADIKRPMTSQEGVIKWLAYDPKLVSKSAAEGKIVFIDFTARWCLTCQANERIALQNPTVIQAFKDLGIVAVKADWTTYDETITQALAELGQNSVPVYVITYPGKESRQTKLLSGILTPQAVLESLREISSR